MPAPSLFEPERHVPLQAAPWTDAAGQAAVQAIVADVRAALQPGQGWAAHPLDEPDAPGEIILPLYHGAGGVLLALRHLAGRGVAEASLAQLPGALALAAGLQARQRPLLQGAQHGSASLLLGDTGLDLLHWLLQPEPALLQRLHDGIRANLHNPVREQLWGNAGTVLAAIHLAETTGDAAWAALVREACDALESELETDPVLGVQVWQQDLYGRRCQLLGGGHGFAGNMFPFLRAAALLPAAQVQRMAAHALATLQATALGQGDALNWPPDVHPDPARPRKLLVQDCHGAPGVLCRLADAPRTAAWDALLLAAGRLTWLAGPLAKGASVCHGTAGSALALLKLWRRSGDALWLERARALALHAAAQVADHRVQHGQGRYSLWTGDLGVACVLQACVDGDVRFPSLDVF